MCGDHVVDLLGRRVRFHDDDHGIPPSQSGLASRSSDERRIDHETRARLSRSSNEKRPRDLMPGPGAFGDSLEVERGRSLDSALGPATWLSPVNVPGTTTSRRSNRWPRSTAESTQVRSSSTTVKRTYSDENQARPDVNRAWPAHLQSGKGCGCPTGNPSAAVRRAASGCHYTRDHLLSLSHPGPAGVQPRAEAGSSPSYHARTTRVGRACDHPADTFTIATRGRIQRVTRELPRFFPDMTPVISRTWERGWALKRNGSGWGGDCPSVALIRP